MTIIGSAYVDIRAITDTLEADIKKALATLPDRIDVPVHADTTEAEKQIDLLVEWGNIHNIDVNVNADTVGAEAHVDAAVAAMSHEEVDINVNADTVGAAAHVDAFVHEESGRDINVPVDVDEAAAITKMAALRAKLDAIAGLKPITIPVAVGNGKGPIGEIENALKATSAELDKANMKLTWFGSALQTAGEHAKTSGSNVGEFLLKLSGMQGLTDLTAKLIELKISLGEEVPKIAMVAEKIGTLATGASYAVGNILSLASGIAQLGGVALALPGIFTGFAIGMGITTTAFGDMKKAVPELAKEMQDLKNLITQDFWSQARSGFQSLIGPTSVLREELVSTSKTVGAFWGTMFDGASKGTFATAMAGDFENLRKSIEITTNGSSVFLHVIQTLGEVGSALLPRLADYFVSITTQFDGFLTKAAGDGSLNRWVENGIAALQDLIGIVTNTIGVLGGLMQAANEAGGTSLHILNTELERLREVILTPGVQTALINIFSGANDAMKSAGEGVSNFLKGVGYLSPALKVVEQDVGKAIGTVLTFFGVILTNPTLFKGVQDLFGGILLGLDHFVTALTPIGDKIGIFFTLVGTIADALGGVFANALTLLLPLLSNLLTDITPLVKPLTDVTNAIVTALAPALGILAQTAFPPLIDMIVKDVLPALEKLIPVLGTALPPVAAALGKAIQDLAPVVGDLVTHLEPVAEKVLDIATKVIPVFVGAITPLVDSLSKIIEATLPLINNILDFAGSLLSIKPVAEVLTDVIFGIVAAIGIYNAVVGVAAFITAILEAPFLAIGIAIALLIAGIVLLVQHWDDVTKAIGDFVNSTMSMLGDFNKNTQGMFDDFFKNTGGMFTDFFNNTVGMFRDFFNNTVGMFVDFFNNTVGMFVDFGTRLWSSVTDIWNGVTKIIGDVIANVISFVQQHWGLILSFIIGPLGLVIQWIVEHWGQIVQVFTDVWNNVVKAVQTGINFVKDVITNVTNFIGTAWENFWNGRIGKLLIAIWDLIVASVKFALAWIQFGINAALNWISSTWNSAWTAIGNFFKSVWDGLIAFISPILANIRHFISDTVTNISNVWNSVWNTIVNFFMTTWNNMVAFYTPIIQGIFNFISDTVTNISNVWNTIWGAIVDFFTTAWNNIVNNVTNSFNTVSSFISDTINNISNVVNSVLSSIQQFFSDAWNNVSNGVTNTFSGIVSTVSSKIDEVMGFVGGIKDKVVGFFNGAGDWLANSGKALIDGLVGGIRSAIDSVTSVIGDVTKAITDHMPHSPAKKGNLSGRGYTTYSGQALTRDLAVGMTSQIGDVEAAANALALAAKPKFPKNTNIFAGSSLVTQSQNGFGGYGQGVAANNGGVVITPTVNVYPSAPLNEKQVGQMAATELFWNFTNR